ESFLDVLDAELEKVTVEDKSASEEVSVTDAELEGLELDVSDEDLAFIEEVSGGAPDVADESAASADGDIDDRLDFDVEEDDLEASADDADHPVVEPLDDDNAGSVLASDPESSDKPVEDEAENFDDSLLAVD